MRSLFHATGFVLYLPLSIGVSYGRSPRKIRRIARTHPDIERTVSQILPIRGGNVRGPILHMGATGRHFGHSPHQRTPGRRRNRDVAAAIFLTETIGILRSQASAILTILPGVYSN